MNPFELIEALERDVARFEALPSYMFDEDGMGGFEIIGIVVPCGSDSFAVVFTDDWRFYVIEDWMLDRERMKAEEAALIEGARVITQMVIERVRLLAKARQ
jgi:hypothetical protein